MRAVRHAKHRMRWSLPLRLKLLHCAHGDTELPQTCLLLQRGHGWSGPFHIRMLYLNGPPRCRLPPQLPWQCIARRLRRRHPAAAVPGPPPRPYRAQY